jgi:tRNA A-37 threonylcarbamoyl transferase component Bud32
MDSLSDAQKAWLRSGPVIAPVLELKSFDGHSTMSYEVMDRSEEGRVAQPRHGHKGFVLKVRDPVTLEEFAAKLALPGDYRQPRLEKELLYTGRLREARNLFVCPGSVGTCAAPDGMPDVQEDFVCFIAPWVNGQTLEERLVDKPIDVDFACIVAREVWRAIKFLKAKGLKHDDLHAGNVMISPKPRDLALHEGERNQLDVSVIDLGSLKPLGQQTAKSRDDHACYVQILIDLFNGIHRNRKVASSHPLFMRKLRQFIDKLADNDDVGRHFPNDDHVGEELFSLQKDLDRADADGGQFQPFEAISAEHLADDSILLDLFVATLPWMQDIQERKPIVLTGPRGCGKSMIFRYLAVKTHLGRRTNGESGRLGPFESFGVYVSCATHLQNNLSWLGRKQGHAAKRASEVSTYFQLVVARELLKSLGLACADPAANAVFHLEESGFDGLVSFISKYFSEPVESPRLTTRSRILHFADDLDSIRVRLHTALLRDQNWASNLPDTFLSDLTAKLADLFPYFKTQPVVFLLDDYSSNRVQAEIQSILTKIIFERVQSHFFKVSCEKFGFAAKDIDGVVLDDTREFTVIDTGKRALEVDDNTARRFVQNLVDRRLERAGWQGKAEVLIGSSDPFIKDEDLAKYIREKGSTLGRRHYYFGLHALGRLWSGDTATILQITREMFVRADVDRTTTKEISKQTQHEAIAAISRSFKDRVEGFHPHGLAMSKVLGQFGSVIREALVKGRLNKDRYPYRLYRLEMTKDEPRSTIELLQEADSEQVNVARELLRRAIFIELEDSRAKEGPAKQTMRWEMRRIFNPAFGLSLRRESYLGIKDIAELCQFFKSPQAFADRVRLSYDVQRGGLTGDLFGEQDD